jgi:hypothetical protein
MSDFFSDRKGWKNASEIILIPIEERVKMGVFQEFQQEKKLNDSCLDRNF